MPIAVARAAARSGRSVHVVALEGEADAAVAEFAHTWVPWGAIGAIFAALEAHGCRDLVIVGGVRRPGLRRIRPDLGFFTNLPAILKLLRGGDDALLTRIVRFFESRGIRVVGAHEVAPELTAPAGPFGRHAPAAGDQGDIAHGLALVAALGPLDVGQAAIVRGGRVVAIEGAEGTDRMLERAQRLRLASPAGVLVKRPKPGQELRIDMPAIGPRTVERAAEARLSGIAVLAGRVLVADREETVRRADAADLFIAGIAMDEGGGAHVPRWSARRAARPALAIHAGSPPAPELAADIAKGLAVRAALAAFETGRAVVVARQHVLAVAAEESPGDLVARTAGLRQWGWIGRRRRRGALVMGATDGALPVVAAVSAGLAALVVARESGTAGHAEDGEAIEAARRHGFLLATVTVARP